jgi:CAAX prenyl protease-like protein
MPMERKGHGWGAYFWPYVSFLLIVEIAGRLPAAAAPYLLPIKVAIPLGLIVGYYARGHYPELRGYRFSFGGVAQDVLVGVVGAAMWMAPYILSDSLRPDSENAFDPRQFGPSLAGLALALRAIGYGIATPFVEELFVRSWLMRYAEVFDRRVDFRDVPIAHFAWRSFAVVVVWFTFSHVSWEWPVALAWILLTQAWFHHRRHLASMVIVHASSNLSILAFVVLFSGVFLDGQGQPIDLWFFV